MSDKLLKIVIIGDVGVGKSSMILRYTENVFIHDPTVTLTFDSKTKGVEINGKNIRLQIWDTLGQERFAQITSSFYKGVDGIIIAYDSSSKESFERVASRWYPDTKRFAKETTPLVIAGCKCDLDKAITTEMLNQWCNQNKCIGIECSSLTGDGIDEIFVAMTRVLVSNQQQQQSNSRENTPPKESKKEKKGGLRSFFGGSSSSNNTTSSLGNGTASITFVPNQAMSSVVTNSGGGNAVLGGSLASNGSSNNNNNSGNSGKSFIGSGSSNSSGAGSSLSSSSLTPLNGSVTLNHYTLSTTNLAGYTSGGSGSGSGNSLTSSSGDLTQPLTTSSKSSLKGKLGKMKSGSSSPSTEKSSKGNNSSVNASQNFNTSSSPAAPSTPPVTQQQFIKRRNVILQIPLPTSPPPKNQNSLRLAFSNFNQPNSTTNNNSTNSNDSGSQQPNNNTNNNNSNNNNTNTNNQLNTNSQLNPTSTPPILTSATNHSNNITSITPTSTTSTTTNQPISNPPTPYLLPNNTSPTNSPQIYPTNNQNVMLRSSLSNVPTNQMSPSITGSSLRIGPRSSTPSLTSSSASENSLSPVSTTPEKTGVVQEAYTEAYGYQPSIDDEQSSLWHKQTLDSLPNIPKSSLKSLTTTSSANLPTPNSSGSSIPILPPSNPIPISSSGYFNESPSSSPSTHNNDKQFSKAFPSGNNIRDSRGSSYESNSSIVHHFEQNKPTISTTTTTTITTSPPPTITTSSSPTMMMNPSMDNYLAVPRGLMIKTPHTANIATSATEQLISLNKSNESDNSSLTAKVSFPPVSMSLSSNAIFVAAANNTTTIDHSDETGSIIGSIIGSSVGREESYNLDDESMEQLTLGNSVHLSNEINSKNFNNTLEVVNERNSHHHHQKQPQQSVSNVQQPQQQPPPPVALDDEEDDPYDEKHIIKDSHTPSPLVNSAAALKHQSSQQHHQQSQQQSQQSAVQEKDDKILDLNERFQNVVLQFRDIPSLDTNLYNLQEISTELLHISQDFIHTVKTYGRIIIEERYLQEKTISSKSMGGHLGGDKYIVRNVLFKFAGGSPHGVYDEWGGAKVGGQELKGCMATLNCPINGLCVPLMALVDFMGFRLIAMSVLPISSSGDKSTIVYGSSDMGRKVHSSHEQSLQIMKSLSQSLNLKPHYGGTSVPPSLVYSATDIEGHIGTDGRFYLIDFSRTFPPSYPDDQIAGGHLYQLFRPEFLKNHPKPLCSDAFSGFIKHDSERHVHNAEVKEATLRLLTEVIPKVSVRLKWLIKEALENDTMLRGGVHIPEQFHRHGINMRWIGHMIVAVDDRDAGFVLLIEAIARVLKNDLRRRFRDTMKSFKQPLSAPYNQLTTNFLNMVFGDSTAAGFNSEEFWEERVKQELYSKFYIYQIPLVISNNKYVDPSTSSGSVGGSSGGNNSGNSQQQNNLSISGSVNLISLHNHLNNSSNGLNSTQKKTAVLTPGWKIRDILEDRLINTNGNVVLGRHLLFTRFREMANLKFRKKTIEKVADTTLKVTMPFNNSDLKKIGVRVKHTDLVTNAEGTFFYAKAMAEVSNSTAVHLMHKARKKFELALISNPNNKETLQLCAQTWCKILEFCASEGKNIANVQFSMNDPLVVNTDRYFLRAIDADPKGPVILFFYARFLVRCKRYEKAEEYFLRSLEVDPFSYRSLIAYANFLTERGYPNEASLFLQRAQECKNIIVGGLK